jgi:hypothetical protein
VEIAGKGNYTGTVYRNFHILQADISDDDGNEAEGVTLKYTEQFVAGKKALTPFTSLKYKKAMKAGTDFKVTLTAVQITYSADGKTYDKVADELMDNAVGTGSNGEIPVIKQGYAGTFRLTVKGQGNYKGRITKDIKVAQNKELLLKNASITLGRNQKSISYQTEQEACLTPAWYNTADNKYYQKDETSGEWTKQANKDDVFTVKLGSGYLKYGQDFEIEYENNNAVGKATMTITGIGDYTGSKSINFNITGTAFNAKNISFAKQDSDMKTDDAAFAKSMIYTGKALTQNGVELKDKEKTLVLGTDYTITYKNNIKKGTATMIFTGKPEAGYTGSFKKTFKITETTDKDLFNIISVSVSEAGEETGFKIEGTAEKDTTVKNPTAAVYKLSGDLPYSREGVKAIDKITLKNSVTNTELQMNKDYTVKYANNTAVGKATDAKKPTMTITFKGNYKGYILVYFSIAATRLDEAYNEGTVKVTVPETAYSARKKDYQPKISVTDGKKTLKNGTDYEVEYGNNKKDDVEKWLAAIKDASKSEADREALRPYATITAKAATAKGAQTGYADSSVKVYLPVYDSTYKLTANNLYVVVEEAAYTGSQVTPDVTVYYGTKDAVKKAKQAAGNLSENDLVNTYKLTKLNGGQADLSGIGDVSAHYTLSYGANTAAGKNKGTVTIKGNGQYGGSVTVKFTINSKTVFQNK